MTDLKRGPCRTKRKRPGERLRLFLVEDTCCSGSNTGTTESISQNVTEKHSTIGPKLTADLMQLLKDEAAERPDLRPVLTEAARCLQRGDLDGFNLWFQEEAVTRYKVAPVG